MGTVVDLFAGPGGWDLAARELGFDPIGLEWDAAACATREAAGLRTVKADVAELDPLDYAPCDLLIASPPCQAWSTAGKGGGRRDIDLCVQAVHDLAAGNDTRAELAAKCEDRRSILVAEPLRWALALKPRLLAWEQVPPVLEMWSLCAQLLDQAGYFTAVGLLSSERYGVPQTRQRAFLIASTDGPVALPMPTHQRYVAPKKVDPEAVGLFDAPERERIVLPEDRHLLPWVSMAQALGWEAGTLAVHIPYGEGMIERHGDRTPRPDSEPAGVVTSKTRSAEWVAPVITSKARTATWQMAKRDDRPDRIAAGAGNQPRDVDAPAATIDSGIRQAEWKYRNGNQANAAERPATEPAPTVPFGHASNAVDWVHDRPAPTVVGSRRSEDGMLVGRQLPPGEGRNVGGRDWVDGRPATTIAGDSRVFQPGGHHEPGQQSQNAVRVSVQEASILQSFPPNYPWQGSRTKQYEQIGNAVPPVVAYAVLREVVVDGR